MKLALSRKNLWERAPQPVRAAAGAVLAAVPVKYLIGRRFRQQLRFLADAQWWSPDQARAYQLSRLRDICQLAYARTRYYRLLFDEAGVDPRTLTFESLRRLPTLSADIVRGHLDEMCTVGLNSRGVDYITTGGTGGKPTRFYINADRSEIEFAYLVSSWQRAGFTLDTPRAVFRGRVLQPTASGLCYEYDRALRQHFYSSFHLNDEQVRMALDHVAGLGPCFLHVYPSSVAVLARFIQHSGRPAPPNIQGILAESENVYPEQRQMVQRTFGCRYFASYGLTEKVVAAAECEHSSQYHVWPTYGYFELLDEDGQPVTTPGARGEIVGTGFINTVVPFVRYRTGDYATYVGDRCERCGRHHPIVDDIRGHNLQEMLITSDGSAISWSALNVHDDTFDRVTQFQFVQETAGRAVLRIVPAEGFDESDMALIDARLRPKIAGRLDVVLQVVDAIPLSGRGKAIYVDQRIPPERRPALSSP